MNGHTLGGEIAFVFRHDVALGIRGVMQIVRLPFDDQIGRGELLQREGKQVRIVRLEAQNAAVLEQQAILLQKRAIGQSALVVARFGPGIAEIEIQAADGMGRQDLMDLLGVIGKRKFIQDLNLIRNIKYTIEELKAIFVLFPESRYSLDGTTSYITPSVGALVHMIKVPVAVLTLHGNFVTHPQWNKKNKHTYVEGEIRPIVLPEEAEEFFLKVRELPNISVAGLMTMGPVCENPEDIRPYFRLTRELFDRLNRTYGFEGGILSMGMSDSYRVAIEEGSTLVRVGRKLFNKD